MILGTLKEDYFAISFCYFFCTDKPGFICQSCQSTTFYKSYIPYKNGNKIKNVGGKKGCCQIQYVQENLDAYYRVEMNFKVR